VKHRFILDIMVLFFAVKGENAKCERDETCANLIQLIGQNCHRIVVDRTMRGKYLGRLAELFGKPQYQTQTALFLLNVVHNSAKFIIETSETLDLPPAAFDGIPKEDHYVVRAGLISHPIIVTDEKDLRDSINERHDVFGLKAVTPAEALELAKDT
jgi:hypothetical protein